MHLAVCPNRTKAFRRVGYGAGTDQPPQSVSRTNEERVRSVPPLIDVQDLCTTVLAIDFLRSLSDIGIVGHKPFIYAPLWNTRQDLISVHLLLPNPQDWTFALLEVSVVAVFNEL